jgi:hypothetical protein
MVTTEADRGNNVVNLKQRRAKFTDYDPEMQDLEEIIHDSGMTTG